MAPFSRLSLPISLLSNASSSSSSSSRRTLPVFRFSSKLLTLSSGAVSGDAATPVLRTVHHRSGAFSPPASFWTRRRLIGAALLSVGGGASWLFFSSSSNERRESGAVFSFPLLRAAESSPSSSNPWELTPRPAPTPSRVADYGVNLNGLKFTLYQYQTCPFCCKTRVFLDYYGISYDVVEVNSVKRTEIKWSKYKKVPLLIISSPDGTTTQINDSSQIVSLLKTFIDHKGAYSLEQLLKYYPHLEEETKGWFGSKKSVFDFPNKYFMMYFDDEADAASKSTAKARSIERKWRSWVDSDFVHRISPNIYGTFGEALEAFRYFDQVGQWDQIFSSFDRLVVVYVGAFVMRIVASGLKKKHSLSDDVRAELSASAARFVKGALKKGAKRFSGGDRPSLADLALYGAMTSFQGCAAFSDMMAADKVIAKWFADVKTAVESHQGQALLKEMVTSEPEGEAAPDGMEGE